MYTTGLPSHLPDYWDGDAHAVEQDIEVFKQAREVEWNNNRKEKEEVN